MKHLIGSILLVLSSLISFGQLGSLKGVLQDEDDGERLVGAYIRIVGTYGAAISDENGAFEIKNIKFYKVKR